MGDSLHVLVAGPCPLADRDTAALVEAGVVLPRLPQIDFVHRASIAEVVAQIRQRIDVVLLYAETAVSPQHTCIARLKAAAPQVPLVLVAGEPTAAERQAAQAAGFADYLPFTALYSPILPHLLEQIVFNDQLAQRAMALKKRLHALAEAQAGFVHDVSHQLRNPLNSILLYLELLELGKAEKRNQYLDALGLQTKRLYAMIEDMVKMARLDDARDQEATGEINLNNLVRAIGREKRASAQQLNVTIHYALDGSLPQLHGRYHQLHQAIKNLVDNAINYSPAGNVHLITAHENAKTVRVTVQDNGIGIPPAEIPYIFQAYYRGRSPLVNETVGTGLGLVLTKKIVEAHHGRLAITSAPDEGTTATIFLPCNGARSDSGYASA